jgi:hypothetical protein
MGGAQGEQHGTGCREAALQQAALRHYMDGPWV